jgi:archaellum component FlaF (FlaF/FlaG flagellin family)
MSDCIYKKGFIALISTVVLFLSTFVFASINYLAVFDYADSINRKEKRIQARLNIYACNKVASAYCGEK